LTVVTPVKTGVHLIENVAEKVDADFRRHDDEGSIFQQIGVMPISLERDRSREPQTPGGRIRGLGFAPMGARGLNGPTNRP
jgi:hypothetical protein